MIAKGDPLARTATRLCIEVEKLLPDVICSILIVEDNNILRPLAGPSLPNEYSNSLQIVPIGPNSGSCGTAAFLRSAVAVTDIETDPRWADHKHLALPHGLRACWSTPVLGTDARAVGTFAFYYREPRGPTAFEKMIVRHCVHLCAIAIEREQRFTEHERQAFTDDLTGLPNRAAFNVALANLDCEVAGKWALFVLDLDNLKLVNDTFGHHAGDVMLQAAGSRISLAFPSLRKFRIGGDEFAVLIETPEMLCDLDRTAELILDALFAPVNCGGHIIALRATIGGAVLSAGDRVAERVRQNADFALYHAKETGRGGFVRYWPGLGTNITRRLSAIRDVDVALREDRIEAYYQPIVRLDTREVVGLEALARMRIGNKIVPAALFHEATTDVHVAMALTKHMIGLVAGDVRHWLDIGIPFQHVGINVSSADLHGGTLEATLRTAFENAGVPLKHVIIEVTETVYMGDSGRVVQKAVDQLRKDGLLVALDDFGTGFASLTHLMTVPVGIIKIDKIFIDRLAPGDASMAIVEGLIGIANKMNIRVVAEGIETEEQARQLEVAGCKLGQGFLFSPAIDPHETTALLLKRAEHRKDLDYTILPRTGVRNGR